MRSCDWMAPERTLRSVVLPLPVPPETTMFFFAITERTRKAPISGSIEVVRTEPGPHGRARVMCRFLEVKDGDDEHLAELVEHAPAAEGNGAVAAADDPELHRPAPVYAFVHGLRDELLSHPPVEDAAEDEDDVVEEPARPRWRLGRPRS